MSSILSITHTDYYFAYLILLLLHKGEAIKESAVFGPPKMMLNTAFSAKSYTLHWNYQVHETLPGHHDPDWITAE